MDFPIFHAALGSIQSIYFFFVLILGLIIAGIGYGVRKKTGGVLIGGTVIATIGFALLVLTYLVDFIKWGDSNNHRGAAIFVGLPIALALWGIAGIATWMIYEFFKE